MADPTACLLPLKITFLGLAEKNHRRLRSLLFGSSNEDLRPRGLFCSVTILLGGSVPVDLL